MEYADTKSRLRQKDRHCTVSVVRKAWDAGGEDDDEYVKFKSMADPLDPVLWCMRLGGVYFTRPIKNSSLKNILAFVHHCVIVILLVIDVIKGFWMYAYNPRESFGPDLVIRLLFHFNHLTSLVCASSAARFALFHEDFLYQVYRQYLKFYGLDLKISDVKEKEILLKATKKRSWICLVVCTVLTFVFTGAVIIQTFIEGGLQQFLQWNLHPYMELSDFKSDGLLIFTVVVICGFLANQCLVWASITSYIVCITLILRDLYNVQVDKFKEEIIMVRNRLDSINIEEHRKNHMQITEIVKMSDQVLSVFLFVAYCSNIPSCCFILYLLIAIHYQGMDYLLYVLFLLPGGIICLGMMVVVTIAGTQLAQSGKRMKRCLYQLNLTEHKNSPSAIKCLQYSSFLNYISDSHFGLSAWQLFNIDKTSLKMIALMIISYTVILVRFGGTSTGPQANDYTTTTPI